MTFLQAAPNGDRQHGAVPQPPDASAANAEAAVSAGAERDRDRVMDRDNVS